MLPLGADNLFPLEVHIRTVAMHRLAQYGIAGERWVGSFRTGGGSAASAAAADSAPRSPTESALAPLQTQVPPQSLLLAAGTPSFLRHA